MLTGANHGRSPCSANQTCSQPPWSRGRCIHHDRGRRDAAENHLALQTEVPEPDPKRQTRTEPDEDQWSRKAAINCLNMGYFSSDRSIREYADRVWNIRPVL